MQFHNFAKSDKLCFLFSHQAYYTGLLLFLSAAAIFMLLMLTIDINLNPFFQLGCCGGDGIHKDWSLNRYFNCSASNPSVERCGVPYSCCRTTPDEIINTQCGFNVQNSEVLRANAGTCSNDIYSELWGMLEFWHLYL